MHSIILSSLQFLLCFKFTIQCVPTFKNTPVLVEEKHSSKFQLVTGCITAKKLKYNQTELKGIKIIGQNFGELREGAISNISEKFQVSLHLNNISIVKSDCFLNLPNLEVINMDENEIMWIETNVFDSLPSLDVINLEKNKIQMLMQHTFVNLPNLTLLSLDDNQLKHFSQDWFFNTPQLKLLLINNNLITRLLKGAFISLPSLEQISLEGNRITYIHKNAFLGLPNLEELTLGHNLLKEFMVDFQANPNIKFLHIHQNMINYIPDTFLEQIQHSLEAIWIVFNPWQCSCLEKYIAWGSKYNIRMTWQCKNTALSCIIPKNNPDTCIQRSDEDFYSDGVENFKAECRKQHPKLT